MECSVQPASVATMTISCWTPTRIVSGQSRQEEVIGWMRLRAVIRCTQRLGESKTTIKHPSAHSYKNRSTQDPTRSMDNLPRLAKSSRWRSHLTILTKLIRDKHLVLMFIKPGKASSNSRIFEKCLKTRTTDHQIKARESSNKTKITT